MYQKFIYALCLVIATFFGCKEQTAKSDYETLLADFVQFVKVEEDSYFGNTFVSWELDTALIDDQNFQNLTDNVLMINYYLTNALEMDSTIIRDQELPYSAKKGEVVRAIKADETLAKFLNGLLNSKDRIMTSISIDSLMDVASRFYYMTDWDPFAVTMAFRFCEGINGLDRNAAREQKLIAAFCYQVLRKNMGSTQMGSDGFYYNSSMRSFRKLAENYPDSVDSDVIKKQLLILRHEMYDKVAADSSVRVAIFSAYREQEESLPFTLTDGLID